MMSSALTHTHIHAHSWGEGEGEGEGGGGGDKKKKCHLQQNIHSGCCRLIHQSRICLVCVTLI